MDEQPRQRRGRPDGGRWREYERAGSGVALQPGGGGSWPAVEHEEVDWHLEDRIAATLDVFERRRRSRPYRAAVTPDIAELDPAAAVAPDTLEAINDVAPAIIRLDAEMSALPVPMPAVLLRSESVASSQIERLTTSARNLAIAELGLDTRGNAKLVAANTRAMTRALEAGDEVTPEAILAIHRALLAESEPDVAGRWRQQQVWIGASAASPHGADYIAPVHARVPAAIDDLCAFAARRDVHPLVQAAVVHAQFETIHPFTDGNGRTGRVLIHTMMRRSGLTTSATVPVSAGLLRDTAAYFRSLDSYRAGDPNPIVRQVAFGALEAAHNGRELAGEITRIRGRWRESIRARSDSGAWRLADELFAQPVVNAEHVSRILAVSDRAARNAIEVLEEAGVLKRATVARRNVVWQAPEVLRAMDDFAARAGRRVQ